jgi:NAD(P)-dependent dehydrogenase (short-subunit alcohol dehydrogenase family)
MEADRKVVLVTGASSGIGKAIASHLAACGHRVFGTSRKPSAAASDGVELLAMDVDDDASVERRVTLVVERAGRLDAVVNNAGWALMGPVEETSIAEARAQMETNFFVRDPSPRTRYSVGMLGQRIVLPLKRFLPQRLFERILATALGV